MLVPTTSSYASLVEYQVFRRIVGIVFVQTICTEERVLLRRSTIKKGVQTLADRWNLLRPEECSSYAPLVGNALTHFKMKNTKTTALYLYDY